MTWRRFFDASEPVFALVAESRGKVVGLAHYLFHRSTTRIELTCYLQALHGGVRAGPRGGARAHPRRYERAKQHGARTRYWQTHESNAAGRMLYDKVGKHAGFVAWPGSLRSEPCERKSIGWSGRGSQDGSEHVETELREAVASATPRLLALSEAEAGRHPSPGKWSPKEVIGHLIDSASNNHQRFVRAGFTEMVFPGYQQEEWVRAQRYASAPWTELVGLWSSFNLHLARVIEATPAAVRRKAARAAQPARARLEGRPAGQARDARVLHARLRGPPPAPRCADCSARIASGQRERKADGMLWALALSPSFSCSSARRGPCGPCRRKPRKPGAPRSRERRSEGVEVVIAPTSTAAAPPSSRA